jgi:hypothetical protein
MRLGDHYLYWAIEDEQQKIYGLYGIDDHAACVCELGSG